MQEDDEASGKPTRALSSREVNMKREFHAMAAMLFLFLAGWPLLTSAHGASGSGVQDVVIVFKTHFDIGSTDLRGTSCGDIARP